jgi:hypothetical protein
MNESELRALEKRVTGVLLDDVPARLLERAAAYRDAADAFREMIRGILSELRKGRAVDDDRARSLRASAMVLVTARERLVEIARLPVATRRR